MLGIFKTLLRSMCTPSPPPHKKNLIAFSPMEQDDLVIPP